MRIIAGKYKGRVVPTLKNSDYRPSTMKFREALFSILSTSDLIAERWQDLAVLDLYAGTGILAFEALSRGANRACLIDHNADHLKTAKDFAEKIGVTEVANFLYANALFLPKTLQQYDLVFLDPPYHQNMASKTLDGLVKNNWLQDQAIVAVELAKTDKLQVPNGLTLVKDKIYGRTRLAVFRYSGPSLV